MYNIKEVIETMKTIINVKSNIDLANYFNISYNTLNTWIKREKLPQEIIINFCKNNNCSLDYLILNKDLNTNYTKTTADKPITFIYHANYSELDIRFNSKITLNPTLLLSNGYYLLKKDNIYVISKCQFNIFSKKVTIFTEITKHQVTLDEFKEINIGLIININN